MTYVADSRAKDAGLAIMREVLKGAARHQIIDGRPLHSAEVDPDRLVWILGQTLAACLKGYDRDNRGRLIKAALTIGDDALTRNDAHFIAQPLSPSSDRPPVPLKGK